MSQDTLWYEDGAVMAIGELLKDEENGEWTYFYPSGEKSALLNYDNGLLEGS